MALLNYDASQVLMIMAGIPVQGLADGTFVSAAFNEDGFTLTVGTDGEGTRAKTNNRSGRVTFTLMQSSSSNDLLSALHNLDLNSPNGDGIGPLLIKDRSGRTLITAESAWIVKHPDAEYAREASTREWIVETDELIASQGGN